MRSTISAFIVATVLAVTFSSTTVPAQAQTAGERFGIGMFTYQNATFVGLAMLSHGTTGDRRCRCGFCRRGPSGQPNGNPQRCNVHYRTVGDRGA